MAAGFGLSPFVHLQGQPALKFIRSEIATNPLSPSPVAVMRRAGFRGRWITVYWHRYLGDGDKTERAHNHPWRLAISAVLCGRFTERGSRRGQARKDHVREAHSVKLYRRDYSHRIISAEPGTLTLFVGLLRDQDTSPCAMLMLREGACHYTEAGEPIAKRKARTQ